jgi:hypothetical protein
MFGLDTISHWQFVQAILLCLAGYYLILLFYLLLKRVSQAQPTSFEMESLQTNKEPTPKVIQATDFPTEASRYVEQDANDLRVSMDREPDYSGYALEALQNILMDDKQTFLNNIEYELQQR